MSLMYCNLEGEVAAFFFNNVQPREMELRRITYHVAQSENVENT